MNFRIHFGNNIKLKKILFKFKLVGLKINKYTFYTKQRFNLKSFSFIPKSELGF